VQCSSGFKAWVAYVKAYRGQSNFGLVRHFKARPQSPPHQPTLLGVVVVLEDGDLVVAPRKLEHIERERGGWGRVGKEGVSLFCGHLVRADTKGGHGTHSAFQSRY
jgi:hypothetical protein